MISPLSLFACEYEDDGNEDYEYKICGSLTDGERGEPRGLHCDCPPPGPESEHSTQLAQPFQSDVC